ncbi:hypothetical protein ANCCAN_23115 [Ancylostoma caninum]|uniref:UBP-type domain-containing protein n=1 Tax=Ancylostoma caninum TaxID=29170 RepID=A0A368FGC1_ANCCA|nr:hypothetical protein ANCCAN_23115 [Ancylostoma caninum]
MTAEQAVSGALVCCEHRNKKSLFKAKEVRKKLKSAKRLCEECERAAKNGIAPQPSEEVFICVSCGYLTCPAHAKKHWEAARTGEKHPLILGLDNCVIR